MSIDARLPVANFLPVPYGQRLPERYVLSPINRIPGETPHPYHRVTDSRHDHDRGASLSYKQDRQTGSVRVITLNTPLQKGTLVDTMA